MGFFNWIKEVLGIEDKQTAVSGRLDQTASEAVATPIALAVSLPMDEDEKNLVAVIAACINGKEQPNVQLHIKRITRIG